MEAQRKGFVIMEVTCKLSTKPGTVPRQADAEDFLDRFYAGLEADDIALPRLVGQATVGSVADGRASLKLRLCFTAEAAERLEELEEDGVYEAHDF